MTLRSARADDRYLFTRFQHEGKLVIKGFIPREQALDLAQRLRDSFKPAFDNVDPVAPGVRAQRLVETRAAPLPRYVRSMYEPQPYRAVFEQLIELRNYLAALPRDFAAEGPQKGWWTAARFNHYPVGGGFMAEHRDAEYITDAPGYWAQPVLFLTERGRDFQQGGALIEGRDVEGEFRAGDVLVYGGHTTHGVAPVDPDTTRTPTLAGRLVAMVTLYKVMT